MSSVTNIILKTGCTDEGDATQQCIDTLLLAFLEKHPRATPPLVQVDRQGGGDKYMECDLFIGAINYLDRNWLLEVFRGLPWPDPEEVQLFLQTQEQDQFTMYTVHT